MQSGIFICGRELNVTRRNVLLTMKGFLVRFKFILVLTIAACASANAIKRRDTSETFHHNSADFAFNLYSEIGKSKQAENIIIAPFSVQTALGLVYFGTSGETAEEFVKGIKLVPNEKSTVANSFRDVINSYSNSPILHVANKIFVSNQYEIKPEFQDVAKNSFLSEVENVDFSQKTKVASTINEWVDAKTNHKIKDIVDANTIDDSAQMIVVNAVHFKADWDKPFKKYMTGKEAFHHSADKVIDVDMMSFYYDDPLFDENFNYGVFDDLGAKALELPYKNSDFSMLFILPKDGKTLSDVATNLQNSNLLDVAKKLSKTFVKVKIPKFKIEFKHQLNQNLENLGLKRVFGDSAELTGIFKGDHHSKISEVIHKTFIEVDESGTEAPGVTEYDVVYYILGSMYEKQPETFYADRPFIFAIKDKAAIHFIGRYTASEYL